MAIDLTGLTPVRQRSQQLLTQSFDPTGGVDEAEYNRLINQKLWGTGTSPGIYSALASRGIRPGSEIPPELNYSTSRAISDSIQQLADQYANRQRSAIETARTSEMVEPTFRLSEANITGELGGAPTLAKQQMDINKLLAEAGLTGVYNNVPTLEAQRLAFTTGPEFGLRQQEVQSRILALQNDMDFRNKLLQIQMVQGIGGAVGSIAQALGIPQMAGDLLRQVIGLPPTTPTSVVSPQTIQAIQQLLGGATSSLGGTVPMTSVTPLSPPPDMSTWPAVPAPSGGGGGGGGATAGLAAAPVAASQIPGSPLAIGGGTAAAAPVAGAAGSIPMTSVAPLATLPDMSLWPAIPAIGAAAPAAGGVGATAIGGGLTVGGGEAAVGAMTGAAGGTAAGTTGGAALAGAAAALPFLGVAIPAAIGMYFTQWGKRRDASAQSLANMAIGGQLASAQTPQDLANIASWTFQQSGEQWRYQRELIDSVAQSLYGSTGASSGLYGQAYPGYSKALEAAFPGSQGGLSVQPRTQFGAPGEALMTEWLRSYIGTYGDLPSPTAFTEALRQYYEPVPVSPGVVAAQQILGLPPSSTIDPVILANIERSLGLQDTGK